MRHAVQHLHFTGIGGAGMSAVAEVLLALGYRVSGSDLNATEVTRRLQALGATVQLGHAASNVGDAQVVVVTAAAPLDNPELLAARERGIPIVQRAVMVAELMRRQQGIAVAGTHGKTTTTALVAAVLAEAGFDPSFIVGGSVLAPGSRGEQAAGANGHLGRGDFIVVEADESDASFLQLNPVLAVVTNIDADHLETYGHDEAQLQTAFVDFIHRLPFYGRAVLCSDDPGVRAVLPRLQRPVLRYGLDAGAELQGLQVQALQDGGMRLVARQSGRPDLPLTLAGSGLHNVRNALAAVAVGRELGAADAAIQRALARYAGVGRRFERHGELRTRDGGHCTLIDDYGHHPVELAAVLAAVRAAFPGRRTVLAFEPHRYTRTRDCMAAFVEVFAGFDVLLLAPVYSAGEAPIDGADGAALMRAVRRAGHPDAHSVDSLDALPDAITAQLRDGDVLLTMGAGTIERVPQQLLARDASAEVAR